jgi:hypothetical protein
MGTSDWTLTQASTTIIRPKQALADGFKALAS